MVLGVGVALEERETAGLRGPKEDRRPDNQRKVMKLVNHLHQQHQPPL